MSKLAKIPVSERALIQRINRRIKDADHVLKCSRPRARSFVGDFYVLDVVRNAIVLQHLDLENYAREVGALEPYEYLAA
jgi:hypothetical protein